MNLQPVTGTPFQLTCISCGTKGFSDGTPATHSTPTESWSKAWFADLDGEPFKTYYCDYCAADLTGTDRIPDNA